MYCGLAQGWGEGPAGRGERAGLQVISARREDTTQSAVDNAGMQQHQQGSLTTTVLTVCGTRGMSRVARLSE